MDDMRYDVAVVGAGQAGLAIGHALAEQGKRFVILEAADSVGSAWRNRWDSLVLFTPRRYDALPGLAFPGDPDGYPTRDEVVAYLERYAEHFELPIELSTPGALADKDARRLRARGERQDDSRRRRWSSRRAIPGAERAGLRRRPRTEVVPDAQRRLPATGGYARGPRARRGRRQHRLPDREGAGRRAARFTSRSAPGRRRLPQRLLGRDLFWWLTKLGLLSKTVESRIGRRARGRDTLIGSSPRDVKRHGVAGAAARRRRRGPHGRLRRRQRAGGRRGDLGDRLPARPLVDRAADPRRRRTPAPPPRRHRRAGPLLPRPLVAAHPRLGAARLRRRRRGVHRRATRRRPRGGSRRQRPSRAPQAAGVTKGAL